MAVNDTQFPIINFENLLNSSPEARKKWLEQYSSAQLFEACYVQYLNMLAQFKAYLENHRSETEYKPIVTDALAEVKVKVDAESSSLKKEFDRLGTVLADLAIVLVQLQRLFGNYAQIQKDIEITYKEAEDRIQQTYEACSAAFESTRDNLRNDLNRAIPEIDLAEDHIDYLAGDNSRVQNPTADDLFKFNNTHPIFAIWNDLERSNIHHQDCNVLFRTDRLFRVAQVLHEKKMNVNDTYAQHFINTYLTSNAFNTKETILNNLMRDLVGFEKRQAANFKCLDEIVNEIHHINHQAKDLFSQHSDFAHKLSEAEQVTMQRDFNNEVDRTHEKYSIERMMAHYLGLSSLRPQFSTGNPLPDERTWQDYARHSRSSIPTLKIQGAI